MSRASSFAAALGLSVVLATSLAACSGQRTNVVVVDGSGASQRASARKVRYYRRGESPSSPFAVRAFVQVIRHGDRARDDAWLAFEAEVARLSCDDVVDLAMERAHGYAHLFGACVVER